MGEKRKTVLPNECTGNTCINFVSVDAATMKEVRAVAEKWMAYDAMLRKISTADDVLWGGMAPKVDAAYDDCVASTRALLAKLGGV